MPETVDAHIHMYPPEAAADRAAWARLHGEPGWLACVAPPGRRSLQGWADLPRLIADMDRGGVRACVMLGWYWERQETCELHNRWHAELIGREPDRLIGFAAVQPAAGQAAIDGLERALDAGMSGIGEMLPEAQGFAHGDPWWLRVVRIAGERGVPIVLHVTDPDGPKGAGPPTPIENHARLVRDFPGTSFILAHWGGGLPFREPALGDAPNVYYDTAASPLLYDRGVFRRVVDRIGAERILYGSDYPLMLYPKESREPGFARFLRDIAEAGLAQDEREKILGGNLRKLLSRRR